MQNTGTIKTGVIKTSEETDTEDTQGIKRDLRDMRHRQVISEIFLRTRANRQPPPELPREGELDGCIDTLFERSKKDQPSKRVNIGASIADSTALVFSMSKSNFLIGLIGIPASEIITLWKNRHDIDTASKLRKNELSRLESMEDDIISRLSSMHADRTNKAEKKGMKELSKETTKLFSDITHKSKEGLTTALGSRLEGFAGSASALFLGLTALKPVSDWVSGQIDSFVLTQQIQPQPYPAALIFYTANLIVKGLIYAGSSFAASYMWDAAYDTLHKNSAIWKRELEKKQLKERAGKLLEKIAEREH
jgi:hypothetical protein